MNYYGNNTYYNTDICHFGILGMKWGHRNAKNKNLKDKQKQEKKQIKKYAKEYNKTKESKKQKVKKALAISAIIAGVSGLTIIAAKKGIGNFKDSKKVIDLVYDKDYKVIRDQAKTYESLMKENQDILNKMYKDILN